MLPTMYSYTAIDTGFDLRQHLRMAILLPSDITHAQYDGADGEKRECEGTPKDIAAVLRSTGYLVQLPDDCYNTVIHWL